MEPLRFNKLTREVGLVLISSSLILAGCSSHDDQEKKDELIGPAQTAPAGWHSGGGHGGYVPVPFAGRSAGMTSGASQGGSAAPASGSARGGFGATGHAATAGS
jgi:hypothetical protein